MNRDQLHHEAMRRAREEEGSYCNQWLSPLDNPVLEAFRNTRVFRPYWRTVVHDGDGKRKMIEHRESAMAMTPLQWLQYIDWWTAHAQVLLEEIERPYDSQDPKLSLPSLALIREMGDMLEEIANEFVQMRQAISKLEKHEVPELIVVVEEFKLQQQRYSRIWDFYMSLDPIGPRKPKNLDTIVSELRDKIAYARQYTEDRDLWRRLKGLASRFRTGAYTPDDIEYDCKMKMELLPLAYDVWRARDDWQQYRTMLWGTEGFGHDFKTLRDYMLPYSKTLSAFYNLELGDE